jgi:hypothetical protein
MRSAALIATFFLRDHSDTCDSFANTHTYMRTEPTATMEVVALRTAMRGSGTPRRLASVSRASWTCPSCRLQSSFTHRRWNSDAATTEGSRNNKPYYLTTPIFYVNAGSRPRKSARSLSMMFLLTKKIVLSSSYWPPLFHVARRCLQAMAADQG